MQAYSESHRRYHDFQHITNCLAVFETARHLANQPDAVAWGQHEAEILARHKPAQIFSTVQEIADELF